MAALPGNITEETRPRFLYAEECGLALFQNRTSGRKFWIDLDHWNDVVECVRMGWVPNGRGAEKSAD